ncbi:MAG: hypothetical protein V1792_09760 [Pseudomonadota bacterium]
MKDLTPVLICFLAEASLFALFQAVGYFLHGTPSPEVSASRLSQAAQTSSTAGTVRNHVQNNIRDLRSMMQVVKNVVLPFLAADHFPIALSTLLPAIGRDV